VKTRKPRLASGDKIVVDASGVGSPEFGSHSGIIKTAAPSEPIAKRATRSMIAFAVMGLTMLFLTYVVLATTVFVALRADGNTVGVMRNTFPVGQAPTDAIVYVSSETIDHTLLGRAKQAVFGVPAGSVVQIVAGPAGIIATNKDGRVVVNGNPTEYTADVTKQTLMGNYVAICVAGACTPGDPVLVGEANIVGEARGYLGLSGLTKVEGVK
jgi:hypothetical protein